MGSDRGTRTAMLAAPVAGLGGVGLALAVLPFHLDDAFITHRYAANVLAGHGLTFEPAAAPAEGFSSPLWLALDLAAGAIFGVEAIPGRRRWWVVWPCCCRWQRWRR